MIKFQENRSGRDMRSETKLLVVGDVMIDEDLFFTSRRTSPEGVPVIDKSHERDVRGGGAFNAFRVARSLSRAPEFICGHFTEWSGYSEASGDERRRVHMLHGIPDRKSRTFVDGRQVYRRDTAGSYSTPRKQNERLDNILRTKFASGAASEWIVVISDYNKGAVTFDTIDIIRGRILNATILVDTARGVDPIKYFGADAVFGHEQQRADDLRTILVRHTPAGCDLSNLNGDGLPNAHWPSFAERVNDTCGAGDTLIAATAAALAAGEFWTEAVTIGCVAAAIKIERPWRDWRAPTWAEIEARREQIRAANLAAWTRPGELSRSTAASTACTADM